jgi:hypothetical protein
MAERRSWLQALVLLVGVAAAVGVALYTLRPPDVVSASAPTTEFSAEQAMEQLEVIADEPRPVGSQEHQEVREYILGEIRALRLDPKVQTTTTVASFPEASLARAVRVKNILVRLEGTSNSQRAVMLSAHYDSWAKTTPGASDCGSCVVTLLETMRALKAAPPPKQDVIFVFTDAEERVSAGAEGFVKDDPWAEDAIMILNFEAAGRGGPAMVLNTNEQNGAVVDGMLATAPHPVVNSLLPALLGPIPGGDDTEVYKENLDAAALDFVYFVDRSVYHTAADNLQTIDPRSVQHFGDYFLALTRHFGDTSLKDLKAPNEVFFTVLPGLTAHYPEAWAIPLAVVLALVFLGLGILGFGRGRLSVGKLMLSAVASLLVLIGALVATTLLWVLVEKLNPGYDDVLAMGFITYNGWAYLIAFAAFTVALTTAIYLLLSGWLGMPNLAVGAAFWWLAVLVLTALYAQGLAHLFVWPLAFGLLALGWMLLFGERTVEKSWGSTVLLTVAAVAGVLIITPAVFILFHAAGVSFPSLPVPVVGFSMLFVALLVGLLVPQLALLRRIGMWLVPGLTALVCLAFLGVGQITSGFDSEHPKPNSVSYELNANTGEAFWLSADRNLGEWTSQFFRGETELATYRGDVAFLSPGGLYELDGLKGPAPNVSLPPPTAQRLNDTTEGGKRTLSLLLASPREAQNAIVRVEASGDILAANIVGKEIDRAGVPEGLRDQLTFSYAGVPEKGFELSLTTDSTGPVKVTVQDISEGLPDVPGMEIESRKPWMLPLQVQAMDPTKVKRSFVFEEREAS